MVFSILWYLMIFVHAFSFLIFLRFLTSWLTFLTPYAYEVYNFLKKITDPYVKIFKFKKARSFDASLFLALISLQLISGFLQTILLYKKISFGIISGFLLSYLSGVFNFIFIVLISIFLLRFIFAIFKVDNSVSNYIDNLIYDKIYSVFNFLIRSKRIISYNLLLGISLAIFLCFLFISKYLIDGILVSMLFNLSF